jgi:hypothetical protein
MKVPVLHICAKKSPDFVLFSYIFFVYLQRLVKYPLLLEQIAKYTDNPTGTSQVSFFIIIIYMLE